MNCATNRAIKRGAITALAAICVLLAFSGCGDEPESKATSAQQLKPVALEQADPRLRQIYDQANELLPGGKGAYRKRVAALQGLPIVVNKWASWCGPCAAEFPFFQEQARKRGAKIAFLGVNTNDARDEAQAFLADFPVPFPSYEDPRAEVAAELKHVVAFPTTAFYDTSGTLVHVHQGQFRDEAELRRAIDRYALGRPAA